MAAGSKERPIIESRCPQCGTSLSLRLPGGDQKGEFTFTCYVCSTTSTIDIKEVRGRGSDPTAQKGKDRASPIRAIGKRKATLRIAAFLLVLSGILGLVSSVLVVSQSFSITDAEDLIESDLTTLSVSVIDADSGRPVEEVRVTVTAGPRNYTSFTDTAGITNLRVPPGSSRITLQKDGYKSVGSEITLKRSTPNVLDVPMEAGDTSETIPLRTPQFVSRKDSTLITDVMAMIMFLSSVIAFVAAYYTYKGDFFLLSVIGSFTAIFSFGFVIGSVMAAVATVVITFSYDHFSHTHVLRKLLELRREEVLERLKVPQRRAPARKL